MLGPVLVDLGHWLRVASARATGGWVAIRRVIVHRSFPRFLRGTDLPPALHIRTESGGGVRDSQFLLIKPVRGAQYYVGHGRVDGGLERPTMRLEQIGMIVDFTLERSWADCSCANHWAAE